MSLVTFLINGTAAGHLPLSDRGLHYGDGVFETIACKNRRLEFWDRHLNRLEKGCRRLSLPLPDRALLKKEAQTLVTDEAVIKIILTRGSGGRGYRPPRSPAPTRIVARYPLPEPPAGADRGITARLCTTRLGTQPALAGLKHLNRLEQVLARGEWSDPDIVEVLMRGGDGTLICGTQSNLFALFGKTLVTPPLDSAGIEGIIREVVLELAPRLSLEVEITPISLSLLATAKGVFVTNSVIGLWPLERLLVDEEEDLTWPVPALFNTLRQALKDAA